MPIPILIADDNPSVRAAMRDVLQSSGDWEIIEAENGEQAVAKAGEFKPRLIILDLAMPGKDGLTAAQEINKLLPETPILMHTLYYSSQIQIEAAKMGVRKVVPKSESSALVSAVHEALTSDSTNSPESDPATSSQQSESMHRRIEDRIRDLCAQIITTGDDPALEAKLAELREGLHQHIEYFRARLAEYPGIKERRIRNSATPLPAPGPQSKESSAVAEGSGTTADTPRINPASEQQTKALDEC
jgi:DNA-binding NarL/FixJ family response regulator